MFDYFKSAALIILVLSTIGCKSEEQNGNTGSKPPQKEESLGLGNADGENNEAKETSNSHNNEKAFAELASMGCREVSLRDGSIKAYCEQIEQVIHNPSLKRIEQELLLAQFIEPLSKLEVSSSSPDYLRVKAYRKYLELLGGLTYYTQMEVVRDALIESSCELHEDFDLVCERYLTNLEIENFLKKINNLDRGFSSIHWFDQWGNGVDFKNIFNRENEHFLGFPDNIEYQISKQLKDQKTVNDLLEKINESGTVQDKDKTLFRIRLISPMYFKGLLYQNDSFTWNLGENDLNAKTIKALRAISPKIYDLVVRKTNKKIITFSPSECLHDNEICISIPPESNVDKIQEIIEAQLMNIINQETGG